MRRGHFCATKKKNKKNAIGSEAFLCLETSYLYKRAMKYCNILSGSGHRGLPVKMNKYELVWTKMNAAVGGAAEAGPGHTTQPRNERPASLAPLQSGGTVPALLVCGRAEQPPKQPPGAMAEWRPWLQPHGGLPEGVWPAPSWSSLMWSAWSTMAAPGTRLPARSTWSPPLALASCTPRTRSMPRMTGAGVLLALALHRRRREPDWGLCERIHQHCLSHHQGSQTHGVHRPAPCCLHHVQPFH